MKPRSTRSTPAKAANAKAQPESLMTTVARTVGSALGTIVATGEGALEKPGEVLDALKSKAAQQLTSITAATTKKAEPARSVRKPVRKRVRKPVRKPRKPVGKKAAARKRPPVKAKKSRKTR